MPEQPTKTICEICGGSHPTAWHPTASHSEKTEVVDATQIDPHEYAEQPENQQLIERVNLRLRNVVRVLRGQEPVGIGIMDEENRWFDETMANINADSKFNKSLQSLRGNSEQVWKLREEFADEFPAGILESIVGSDDERAWAIRERILTSKDYLSPDILTALMRSTTGLDSERTWQMREKIAQRKHADYTVGEGNALTAQLESITGLDSEKAWNLRKQYLNLPFEEKYNSPDRKMKSRYQESMLTSLQGLDTEEAWEMRGTMRTEGEKRPYSLIKSGLLKSVNGLETPRAWQLRSEILEELRALAHQGYRTKFGADLEGDPDVPYYQWWVDLMRSTLEQLAKSFDGSTSKEAEKFREKMLGDRNTQSYVVNSLTGIDTPEAWELRDKFFFKSGPNGAYSDSFDTIKGLHGDRANKLRVRQINPDQPRFGITSMFDANDINKALSSLEGVDDEHSWKLREQVYQKCLEMLEDSGKADKWKRRDILADVNKIGGALAGSLRGLQGGRVWQMRQRLSIDFKNSPEVLTHVIDFDE